MTTKNYELFDAINREGLGNEDWGLVQDVNTQIHFATIEDVDLKGMYVYVTRVEDDFFAYIKQKPSMTLHIDDNIYLDLFKI